MEQPGPKRFQSIDESNIDDHAYLRGDDKCYYLHEYTSGQNFAFGMANNLISNLKKSVSRRGRPEYAYKLHSISTCSKMLSQAIKVEWLEIGTIVPVPPSKCKNDPNYDDRLVQICQGISAPFKVDVRELIVQKDTIRAAHESPGNRPSVSELEANYCVNENVCFPRPRSIAIVDDVLTAGTHFRAMHNVITRRFPGVSVYGMFIARRVFPTSDSVDNYFV